jgi:hypothetical protein
VGARREQVVLGAVAAAVLAAIVVFAASSGVEPGQPTPTPSPTPRPTFDRERELFGGSLEPGVRYRTRAFVPALSFEVADTEWLVRDATPANVLNLERRRRTARPGSERPPRSFLTFSRIAALPDPDASGGDADLALTDLHAWMRRHPDLRVGPAEPVTVGGVPGESFHVTVQFTRPARPAADCRPLLIVCTSIPPDRFLPNGVRMRTVVLRTEPPLEIDLIGRTARDLDAVEVPAAQVLRSLRIGVR